jgi:hypothetical protein
MQKCIAQEACTIAEDVRYVTESGESRKVLLDTIIEANALPIVDCRLPVITY